jgi:hypothetical protein
MTHDSQLIGDLIRLLPKKKKKKKERKRKKREGKGRRKEEKRGGKRKGKHIHVVSKDGRSNRNISRDTIVQSWRPQNNA